MIHCCYRTHFFMQTLLLHSKDCFIFNHKTFHPARWDHKQAQPTRRHHHWNMESSQDTPNPPEPEYCIKPSCSFLKSFFFSHYKKMLPVSKMSSLKNYLKSSAILALYQATPTLSLLCNTQSLNQVVHHKWTNQLSTEQLPSLGNTSVFRDQKPELQFRSFNPWKASQQHVQEWLLQKPKQWYITRKGVFISPTLALIVYLKGLGLLSKYLP